MNHLRLTHDTLDVGKICNMTTSDSCGAISMFIGTTRDSFEGKQVLSLEYEAYESMALKQLKIICDKLRNQWPDIKDIAIFHRLGLVRVGEVSVVIAISSPHRDTSLNAVPVAINDLKKRVPIWKKEIYKGDQPTWKENKECQWLKNVPTDFGSALFNEDMCGVDDSFALPKQLIQISASEDEINRRIDCFVKKKRNEIDLCNIMDFTNVKKKHCITQEDRIDQEHDKNESMTCARVNSIVVKQEFSKGHLKVKQVANNIGPQTLPPYFNTLDKLMVATGNNILDSDSILKQNSDIDHNSQESNLKKSSIILERLESIEEYLNISQPDTKNIYQRLKIIEDRLLYLESISPEYIHFLQEKSDDKNPGGPIDSFNDIKSTSLSMYERKLYSVNDIDTIIKEIKERNTDPQNSLE